MATNKLRILEFITKFPDRDDDEIATALKISPRQTVNIICRDLAKKGAIERRKVKFGKIVNRPNPSTDDPTIASHSLSESGLVSSAHFISEDFVKEAIAEKLEADGWAVKVAWGRERGIDIVANRESVAWIIECKGTGSRAPMQNNYFVGVLGEIFQRMNDETAKYSVAFPDHKKFRRLWSEIPPLAKSRLRLTALFIDHDGKIEEQE